MNFATKLAIMRQLYSETLAYLPVRYGPHVLAKRIGIDAVKCFNALDELIEERLIDVDRGDYSISHHGLELMDADARTSATHTKAQRHGR